MAENVNSTLVNAIKMFDGVYNFDKDGNLVKVSKKKDVIDHIVTIKEVDFNENVLDSAEKSRRERLQYNFQKLYSENKDIPSLLENFFKESATFSYR
ncbi:hypothetical protein [Sulfurimonas sp.]